MTAVRWADIDPTLFERMVTTLIKNMHPSAERIDGSGGDQGREIQIATGDTLKLFLLKSFTGRVGKGGGRRRQVERSLSSAMKVNPTEWYFVVPIDPTPGEKQWFDGLRQTCDFDLHWCGQNWLDSEIAPRPYLTRYFLEDGAGEAVRLLTELREENAAVARGVLTPLLGLSNWPNSSTTSTRITGLS